MSHLYKEHLTPVRRTFQIDPLLVKFAFPSRQIRWRTSPALETCASSPLHTAAIQMLRPAYKKLRLKPIWAINLEDQSLTDDTA